MAVTYEDYKPIRNRIRKLDAESLLLLAVQKLHETDNRQFGDLGSWLPWNLLLIVKWTLQDGDFTVRKRAPSLNDLAELMNWIHDLPGRGARLPGDFTSIPTFMKAMAFQQFWLQRSLTSSDVGRQVPLLCQLSGSDVIGRLFRESAHVALEDFLELSFVLAAGFLARRSGPWLSRRYFAQMESAYPEGTLDRFLDLLALDPQSARQFLVASDQRVRDFDARLYEQTPLRKRPLLSRLRNDDLLCYSPRVLLNGLASLAYDLLKDYSPERFTEAFGAAFEDYVRMGLDYLGSAYFDESMLRTSLGRGKVIDYLVPFRDANILIESKAIELSPHARVSPNISVVNNHLRSSIIKAIKQGIVVADKIRRSSLNGVNGSADCFLIVVTFKELNIGSGRAFITGDVQHEVDAFCAQEGLESLLLPREAIYFLDVAEFEWLVALSKRHNKPLTAIVREARAADDQAETQKFQFWQHLHEQFGEVASAPFASDPFDDLYARLVTKLRRKPHPS